MKRAAKSESMTGSTCSLLSAVLSGIMGGAEMVVRSGVSGKARRMMWSKRKMQRAKAQPGVPRGEAGAQTELGTGKSPGEPPEASLSQAWLAADHRID